MFKSIEAKYGVDQLDYQPPVDQPPKDARPWGWRDTFLWILLIPAAGLFIAGSLAWHRERGVAAALSLTCLSAVGWYLFALHV